MKKRFEIPLSTTDGLDGINLFAVDDFLRAMNNSAARRELIMKVGGSARSRSSYEKSQGLPYGAVELVMLMEDKRVRELHQVMLEKMTQLFEKDSRAGAVEEIYKQTLSVTRGLQQLYPEATDFMLQYAALSQRNRRRFMGDYAFGNEYKLQLVDCFLSCDSGLNCNANINITVNVNLVANVNAAVVNKVALLLIVFLFIVVIPP